MNYATNSVSMLWLTPTFSLYTIQLMCGQPTRIMKTSLSTGCAISMGSSRTIPPLLHGHWAILPTMATVCIPPIVLCVRPTLPDLCCMLLLSTLKTPTSSARLNATPSSFASILPRRSPVRSSCSPSAARKATPSVACLRSGNGARPRLYSRRLFQRPME